MILSASRRTDIPACYGEWFLGRLREGFLLVPNPYGQRTLRRIQLSPEAVDCIVFWSKNPQPFLQYAPEISAMGYPFCFQFTLNPYGQAVERRLPALEERVKTFQRLSALIGPERIAWRYDPVILGKAYPADWHFAQFERLCALLHGHTSRCIFSFFDRYAKDQSGFQEAGEAAMRHIARGFSAIAGQYGLPLFACSEPVGLSAYGVARARCIDPDWIGEILGCPIRSKKDPNQRPLCGCVESVEIGSYDSCTNGCVYCYANQGIERALRRAAGHDPRSPMLLGRPDGTEKITNAPAKSLRLAQTTLFE